ncbi:hypothetical protein [Amorphus orientalis]|uniref:Uncharacterized protein n=1 Tax=Amorphus orientalis TaxID=649198 RepID=A0AAE4AU77_9HYPH|nr:hypothetical protein [Amorphus orientalis]MDQ0315659.1 hypothetical protein [Amorphus orientalis]
MFVATRVSGIAALTALLAFTQPSLAFEKSGNDVADAFLRSVEAEDTGDVTYGNVSEDGDTLTISDLKIEYENEDGAGTATVKTIEIVNGSLDGDDVLSADEINLDGIELTERDSQMTVSVASGNIVKPTFPTSDSGDDAGKPVSEVADYDKAEFDGLVFTDEDGAPLPIDKIMLEVTDRIDGKPRGGTMAVERAVLKTDSLEEGDTKERLTALGYDQVVINIDAAGKWDSEAGEATLDTFTIDAEDMGTLTLDGKFSGVTPEVIEKLQSDQMEFSQLMQVLQGVSIVDVSLTFRDMSITDRALENTAEEQGTDKDELISQMVAQAQAALQTIDNKPFEDQVMSALKTFLNDPQSLQVAIRPGQPVPLPQVVGTAMMAPQTLPTVLSVDVTANDAPASDDASGSTGSDQ